jgi:hypothetical protein
MLTGVLAFFGTPFGRNVGMALAVLALIAGFYGFARHQGANSIRKADEKATQAAKLDLAKHEATAANISATASSNLVQRQAQIITRYRTLTVRLPDVAKNDADCRIGPDWIGLWNLAAGDDAGIPSSPDRRPEKAAS